MRKKQKALHHLEDVIFLTRSGIGYVAFPNKKDGEVKIENRFLNTALHGDYVRILIHPHTGTMQKTGEVISVLARAKHEFVGTVHKKQGVLVVRPQDPRFYTHISIPQSEQKNIAVGEKVLVRIGRWDKKTGVPSGSISEKLGRTGEHETEIRAILRDRGIVDVFPNAVVAETKHINESYHKLFKKEVGLRKDLRHLSVFTIDPDDAKDFDDALSIRNLPNGNYEVGIHIADVSFFVRKGTALDIEAARRSTTLYLVDRTVPMLPTLLSNNLCSLRPDENRLAFSAIFEMTKMGQVKNRWFGKTIIRSHKRFTYGGAQAVLDRKDGDFYAELAALGSLAKHLRMKREERGALSFVHDEIAFELDERGIPLRVFRKKYFETNELVEDFMVLANSEVAHLMSQTNPDIKRSFIYRVHDLPDTEKIKELERVMRALGYKTTLGKKHLTSKDIANLLRQVANAPHREMIHMLTVRALAKAVYTTKNIGHFGLSLKHYTHFTSPIRRYPDLVVHRMLNRFLNKETISPRELAGYEALSRYATQAEISAQDAERASVKYKQAEYMSQHTGESFNGIITGLSERGVFVSEDETLSEGMVSVHDLTDDYYRYDTKKAALVGRRTKKKYALGDRVKIKIKRVDIEARLIDYVFT